MPKVGNQHFPYTKKGIKDAKNRAKKTGKKYSFATNAFTKKS